MQLKLSSLSETNSLTGLTNINQLKDKPRPKICTTLKKISPNFLPNFNG